VARTLFSEAYLSTSSDHEGLILHAVYHRPMRGIMSRRAARFRAGSPACGGIINARELALLILRMARGDPVYTFFGN